MFTLLCIGSYFSPVYAQFGNLFGKKNKDSDKNVALSPIQLFDTASILKSGKLYFHNIGKISYYYDKNKISLLNKYQRERNWESMLPVLYDYVCHFGTENFYDPTSMDILWQLGRVSEYMEKMELTKEVYRYILKHYRGDLQKALKRYDSLSKFDKDLYVDLAKYYDLVDLRKHIDTLKPPQSVFTSMGETLNSPYEEYGLTISGNDDELIYTSRRDINESVVEGQSKLNENLYFSRKTADDEWENTKALNSINTAYNEGSPCLSKDGKTLIFARCFSPDGLGNCDLYICQRIADTTWSEPINLGEKINSYAWDSHPSLSISGDTLFFSSDRRGGFGGTDIYFSVKNENGEWTDSKNLGPMINTKSNEVSPFMHAKHNVLYFSSDGHLVNFGRFDIYKTYFYKNHWTEPKNVGPLVNTKGSEFYFAIDALSKKLFYARSQEEEPDNLDLYSFPLPMEAQPLAVVRFTGRIVEEATGEVFEGIVSMIDLDENIEIAPKYLREDGSFQFDLINNKRYMLMVQGENFFRIEEIFYLNGEKNLNLSAKSIKSISFESIQFENGKADLLPSMENDLHLLVSFLVDNPDFKLKITGHTDSGGDQNFNLKLSQKRADAIKDYIISYGRLEKTRVLAIGLGSQASQQEQTEEQRRLNRRVEFKILRKEDATEGDSF
ncbi:MAG: OmpA family protein [Bacteroidetes bacterium]|nr:MAG: OmpA family protein [Bacteroidota bacterium]